MFFSINLLQRELFQAMSEKTEDYEAVKDDVKMFHDSS